MFARRVVNPSRNATLALRSGAEVLFVTSAESRMVRSRRSSMSQEQQRRAALEFARTRPTDAAFGPTARVKRPFVEVASNASTRESAERAAVFLRAPRGRSGGRRQKWRTRGPLERLFSWNYQR